MSQHKIEYMFVRARVINLGYISLTSFLAGGLARQSLQDVTLCGDRAPRALKRMVKCEFWLGLRRPSAEIVGVKCSNVR